MKYRSFASMLYDSGDGCCYLCGELTSLNKDAKGMMATVDHVIPISRGGSWEDSNLRLAHSFCNTWKGDRLLSELGDNMNAKELWNALQSKDKPTIQESLEVAHDREFGAGPNLDACFSINEDAERAAYRKWLDSIRRDEIFPVQLAELAWLERASRG